MANKPTWICKLIGHKFHTNASGFLTIRTYFCTRCGAKHD